MKSITERIYENIYEENIYEEDICEGFYDNITPFDNTPVPVVYYTLNEYRDYVPEKTDFISNRIHTTISKSASLFGIDELSNLILKVDPQPRSTSNMYKLERYYEYTGENRVFKAYTSGAVKKIIAKLCEDPANKTVIKDMYSSADLAMNNVQLAFGLAVLKANNIVSKNFRYVDLNKNDMETAKIGFYLESALTCMNFNAYDLPLSTAQLSAKFSSEQSKYNNAIYKLDKLKADITTLRDNGYPFNAMIERTLSDIDARNQVITRLVKKYQK